MARELPSVGSGSFVTAAGGSTSFVGSSNEVPVEGIEEALGYCLDRNEPDDREGSAANTIDFTEDFGEPEGCQEKMSRGDSAARVLKRNTKYYGVSVDVIDYASMVKPVACLQSLHRYIVAVGSLLMIFILVPWIKE